MMDGRVDKVMAEIPLVIDWLNTQPGFQEFDVAMSADELMLRFDFSNLTAEMAFKRRELTFYCQTEQALLLAVKKVVHGVLKSVIIGL